VLGRRKMRNKTFSWENLKEGDHMEDLCTKVMDILKIVNKWGCSNFILMAQDRDNSHVLLNIVMNPWVT
jgi:hypothetical protein